MLASSRAYFVGLGNLVGPIGAVALGRPIGEPADIVGTIFERWAKTSEPPLNRRQLGARQPAVDDMSGRRSRSAQHSAEPFVDSSRVKHRQRRLFQCSLDGLGAQLGAKSLPGSLSFSQAVAEVPGRGMECPECRLRGLEVGRRHVKDETTPLHKLNGTAIRVGFVAIMSKTAANVTMWRGTDTP